MKSKLWAVPKSVFLVFATLFVLTGQARALTTDLGAFSVPSSTSFADTFSAPLVSFSDYFTFSIPSAAFNSITSTVSLGQYLGIANLQASLWSGTISSSTGLPAGSLLTTSTPIIIISGTVTSTIDVINPITLGTGNYILQVSGNVTGLSGGSYSGTLNVSPVPEAAEWTMLLLGLLMATVAIMRVSPNARVQSWRNCEGANVIDTYIDALSWGETLTRIARWARARESRYICICNVHSVVTASHDADFKRVLNLADMATPDGMPVAWMLSRQGFVDQERINGPDLMWKYCALAERSGEVIYFYGSTEETLGLLSERLRNAFPGLRIGGAYSPPFRELSAAEDDEIVASINNSGAGVVFVSLGCPKQEKWMEAHRNRIQAVMIGVGAAFSYHAGTIQRAPLWMRNSGLEWLHRLCSEPGRLWKRYLITNTIFIVSAVRQLFQVWSVPR